MTTADISRKHKRAGFLGKAAIDEFVAVMREAKQAAEALRSLEADVRMLKVQRPLLAAVELAHMAIHNLLEAEFGDADDHVRRMCDLFGDAAQALQGLTDALQQEAMRKAEAAAGEGDAVSAADVGKIMSWLEARVAAFKTITSRLDTAVKHLRTAVDAYSGAYALLCEIDDETGRDREGDRQ
jgi:hypothetical protein